MRKNLAAVVAVAVAAALLTLPADARPRNQSAPMRSGNTKYRGKRRRWMAASPGGHARAGSKRSNTMGSGCLTVPTAIDVVGRHAGIRQELVPGPAVRRDGRGLGTMTKKPVRRYTVDGKRMTPTTFSAFTTILSRWTASRSSPTKCVSWSRANGPNWSTSCPRNDDPQGHLYRQASRRVA